MCALSYRAVWRPALHSEAGFTIHYHDVGEHDPRTLEAENADLLIVLGGPISAYDVDCYPFINEEIAILEKRVEAQNPTLGVCLGAQLIARSAGARVYSSGAKEIGFAPIALTDNGRSSCLTPFADEPMTLHWHGDTFDLPAGAERLASTDLCQNQAFSMGPNIIGFQFHPEAPTKGFENWLIGHAAELAAAGADIHELRADAEKYGAELERKARRVATDWLAQLE